jgi:phosphoribosylaminoimidazolecarboxamide formyltransferase / IMP cyclohydrolase
MKQALISVSNKTRLIDFAQQLIEKKYQIISTGGTYKHLVEASIPCKMIDEVTGFPEIFDGRVKTLHPKIHGGLLGIRDHEKHQIEAKQNNIEWIDMVVVNLYPFKETVNMKNKTDEDIIEQIDIGGPSMLRSAAKNHRYVTVVSDVNDYDQVIKNMDEDGNTSYDLRRELAAKVYQLTASYDAYIATYLTKENYPEKLTLTYEKKQELRYGENPHQSSCFYVSSQDIPYSISSAIQLHGKALSYNNIQDAEACLNMLKAFETHTVVAVKHMNPCGIGTDDHLHKAWEKAYNSDPTSIFGGIVALSGTVDLHLAKQLGNIFLEVILAPDFTDEALEHLRQKKNIRLMKIKTGILEHQKEYKSVSGGLLLQDEDQELFDMLSFPTKAKPLEKDIEEMIFAYRVVKFVKSNAIVLTKDFQTIGIGAGQMNRVGAAKIAIEQAKEKAKDAYLASDAFFPMPDTVELAIKAGVKAIIQPGGSIKDQESIDLCDAHGIPMVFTAMRHFKH